ncbi:hypothetical protein [Nostoc linckia]|uniref:hypothetical protein n=1 Tax=Nostoc linckia TaxID=92942 RepID=UPI0011804617|nr:hypothetical protein [Nostoc linckia]
MPASASLRNVHTAYPNHIAIASNTVREKGKGERGKVSNTSKSPYPLTFSQTTRQVHTAYPNRIAIAPIDL